MSVNLAFIGGAGWQFFDDSGNPLSGGKVYTYDAGTTTPQTTYTSRSGTVPNANPIILDAAGRTPEQIWSTEGILYKYVVKNSNDVLIRSWDNIGGTVVASDLSNDLANTSDNAKGDALVGFKQSNANGFLSGATASTVNNKLQEVVSVLDFGAVGDGVTDDTSALQTAITTACAIKKQLFWPKGTYLISSTLTVSSDVNWRGEGGAYSVIKQNGLLQFMMNDNNTPVTNVIIDGLGFDFNGYNTSNFGTAINFNSVSHENLRIVNNKIFDTNYPGDGNINQRQAIFVGQNATNIWVLNNNISEGGRIKIGYGGKNVFIQRNKLNYIDDNGITMAMLGTAATPSNQITENVHIEDNIIINPTNNGIFFGADGEDKNDPAMTLKNVSVARNIIVLDTPFTDDFDAPRFIIGVIPYNGASDIAINDNICVMTSNTPDAGFAESIRIGSVNGSVGTLKRLSISRNKLTTPYKRPSAVQVGYTSVVDDLVISDNYFEGYSDTIFLRFATAINRPTITNNVITSSDRGLRIGDSNPIVTAGSYSRNRVVSPTSAALFSSTSAMEWRVESNEIINSAGAAIQLDGAGTKNFYIINNDLRGAASGPITFTNSAALTENSARFDNLGDTALITVASAATITIPNARVISISGTTNIDTITATGRVGQVVTLRFSGILTVNDGAGNLLLAGNFTTSANDTLTLACTGASWEEVSRSVN
jgi:hypothetical protein